MHDAPPNPRRGPAAALLVLLLAPALLAAVAPEGRADTMATLGATLPTARDGAAAVWADGRAYVLGGRTAAGPTDQILRYDPATGTVVALAARLPTPRSDAAAVWDGRYVYVLGGLGATATSTLNDVVRFDPATGAVTTPSLLPGGRASASAVWTGRHAYVFGGVECIGSTCQNSNQALRFDPATNTVVPAANALPTRRNGTAAAWDGRYAYVAGGLDQTGPLTAVLRFDPDAETFQTLLARLPSARHRAAAVYADDHVLVLGGAGRSGRVDEVVKIHPTSGDDTVMRGRLPTARDGVAAAWDGRRVLAFGGHDAALLRDVLAYSLEPAAPAVLSATPGPAAAEISLAWTAPTPDTYGTLTGYRVYRSAAGGAESLLASVGADVTTFLDASCAPGTECRYRIAAVNSGRDEGPKSAAASATSPTLPGAPRDVTATPGPARGAISLTWQPPASDGGAPVTGYRVYAASPGGAFALIGDAGSALAFAETGLADGAERRYRVAAVNLAGEGAASAEAAARAPALPAAPRALSATPGRLPGEVALRWEPPVDAGGVAVAYRVYRSADGVAFERVADGVDGTAFVDVVPAAGALGVHHYRVSAVNVVGEGAASAGACSAASPWPEGIAPPTSSPCPLPAGWREDVVATRTVGPLPGPASLPPVRRDALSVHSRTVGGYYEVEVEAAGIRFPLVAFPVPAPLPPVDVDLVDVPTTHLRQTVSVTVHYRHDPSLVTCFSQVGGVCLPSAANAPPAARALDAANRGALVVDVRVTDGSGALVARQAVTVPIVGQGIGSALA